MFEFKENRRNVPDKELIEDIIHVASKVGKGTVTIDEYNQYGLFHASTVARRFGSWTKALDKAELLPSRSPLNIPIEELFLNLADVWGCLGRQPRYQEMTRKISKFSVGTYENRFGSWNKALRAFINYIENNADDLPVEKIEKKSAENRTPRNINWRLRAKVLIRDNCICQMCGASPAKDPDVILHVDHVTPWSKGGETVEENLRTLCSKCNIGKSDMLIEDICL